MKIHLNQIPNEGLHFDGEEPCVIDGLEAEDVRCDGPLQYSIDVGVSSDALWATGRLVQPVELRCVSCLDFFPHEIEIPAFAVHVELSGPEVVDLTPLMREDLLLNLPSYPHCDREGHQICRRPELPGSLQAKAETLTGRPPDWSVLDQLEIGGPE